MDSRSSEELYNFKTPEELSFISKYENSSWTKIKRGIPLFTKFMAVMNVAIAIIQVTSLGLLHESIPLGCHCPDKHVLEPWCKNCTLEIKHSTFTEEDGSSSIRSRCASNQEI